MSIITNDPISYFKGDINIPFDNKDTSQFVANYLNVYEREILISLLGYELYNAFIIGLRDDPGNQIWDNLLNGAEYNVYYLGKTYQTAWNGFMNTEKVSIITHYTYFNWLRSNNEQLSGNGVIRTDKENATNYDSAQKLINAYNVASNLAGSHSDHPLNQSLYNYLYNHIDDYDKWVFNPMGKINMLGV